MLKSFGNLHLNECGEQLGWGTWEINSYGDETSDGDFGVLGTSPFTVLGKLLRY